MTLKPLLRTFGRRTAKTVFVLSLLLSCLSFGPDDPQPKTSPPKPVAKAPLTGDPVAQAKAIKSSPLYQDPGLKQQTNWLSGAADRLQNMKGPSCDCKNAREPGRVSPSAVGEVVKFVMWTVLFILLAAFLYFAASRYAWTKKLRRRASALMEEDEPERTVDEWLQRSRELEQEGKYREAVRCLYLACLLRLDEARIVKFEKGETNWEHLARFESSPVRPSELDLREPTKAFDQIWYGMRVKGPEDVAKFRTFYQQVTDLTRSRAA